MGKFLNLLDSTELGCCNGRAILRLDAPLGFLVHQGLLIEVPRGFETDLASVPRVPIAFWIWGDRAHREAVVHDFCYRSDAWVHEISGGVWTRRLGIPKEDGDWYFREAMISQGQPYYIYQPMFWGVRLGGGSSFHRMKVMDHFDIDGG